MIQVQNQKYNGKISGKRISETIGRYKAPTYVNNSIYCSSWDYSNVGYDYSGPVGDVANYFSMSVSGNDLIAHATYLYNYYGSNYEWVILSSGGQYSGYIRYTIPQNLTGNYYISVTTNFGVAGNYNLNAGDIISYYASGNDEATISFYTTLNWI